MRFGSRLLSLIGIFLVLLILFVADRVGGAADASGSREIALVAIVFDDAHHSFPSAVEKMTRLNMRGTVYVPTGLVDMYDFHTSWNEIVRANQLGWEVGAHTVTHPDLRKINIKEVQEEVFGSAEQLNARGIEVKSFAAPYGESNPNIQSIVMKRFLTNRMAWGESVITPENIDVRSLPVFDLSHAGTDSRSMGLILEKAVDSSGLAIIVFHKIALAGASSAEVVETLDKFTVREDDFDVFLKRVSELEKTGQLRVVTVSEGVLEIQRRRTTWNVFSGWMVSQFQ